MGCVYRRGKRWAIKFKDADGKTVRRVVGPNKREAQSVLKDVEGLVREGQEQAEEVSNALTLETVANHWMTRRQKRGLKMTTTNGSHLTHHILPYFGKSDPRTIKVRNVRLFVEHLETKTLAPRTVRAIYATLKKLFNDLVIDEIVDSTPCVLSKDHLPRNIDADPEWRAGAIFTAKEVRQLLTAPLPTDGRAVDIRVRRLLYAFGFYTGGRVSEVLALRWRHIRPCKDLDKLIVVGTKTGVTREVPIHPVLARLLKDWELKGWELYQGRKAKGDDLIMPRHDGAFLHKSTVLRRLKRDLLFLGLRERRYHDTRRTFVTASLESGARRDVLKRLTHTSINDMVDLYTAVSWEEKCKAVICLNYGENDSEDP